MVTSQQSIGSSPPQSRDSVTPKPDL